jgi:hypothetical protein
MLPEPIGLAAATLLARYRAASGPISTALILLTAALWGPVAPSFVFAMIRKSASYTQRSSWAFQISSDVGTFIHAKRCLMAAMFCGFHSTIPSISTVAGPPVPVVPG